MKRAIKEEVENEAKMGSQRTFSAADEWRDRQNADRIHNSSHFKDSLFILPSIFIKLLETIFVFALVCCRRRLNSFYKLQQHDELQSVWCDVFVYNFLYIFTHEISYFMIY